MKSPEKMAVIAELDELLAARPDEFQQSRDHIVAKLAMVWDEYSTEIKTMQIPELAGYLVNAVGYYNGIAHPFVRR
jgi:hypothetical protein